MEIIDLKDFKKKFMKETDPNTGNKVGVLIQNVKPEQTQKIKEQIGIGDKNVKYYLFFNHFSKKKVILFNNLEDFKKATDVYKDLMNKCCSKFDFLIPLHVGGWDLGLCIDVNEKTKPTIRKIQKRGISHNYNGIVVGDSNDN